MDIAVRTAAAKASAIPKKETIDPDAPRILRFNPLFAVFGWQVWWRYEYVGGVLTRSETQWRRVE
jgi:hypothetical protein